jgi:hypothetical protein
MKNHGIATDHQIPNFRLVSGIEQLFEVGVHWGLVSLAAMLLPLFPTLLAISQLRKRVASR